jgi:hypothetical protein
VNPIHASLVSGLLRQAGFVPAPPNRTREGYHVQRGTIGGQVIVSIDNDNGERAEQLATEAAKTLTAAGYSITPAGHARFVVTR